jgi:hypothetical protein
MKRLIIAAAFTISSMIGVQAPAYAVDYDMSEEYAAEQCGNNNWAVLQYPTYQDCHNFAVYYYYLQVPGGRGTFFADLPGYSSGGCGSRLCGDVG